MTGITTSIQPWLSVDGAEFWVSGHLADVGDVISKNLRQEVIRMILVVENPDAVFQHAIKVGATEVYPVGEDFGWRLGRLSDPFGIDWEIVK